MAQAAAATAGEISLVLSARPRIDRIDAEIARRQDIVPRH
jgi:hypothetical protein